MVAKKKTNLKSKPKNIGSFSKSFKSNVKDAAQYLLGDDEFSVDTLEEAQKIKRDWESKGFTATIEYIRTYLPTRTNLFPKKRYVYLVIRSVFKRK
jgi:hypothetical protein